MLCDRRAAAPDAITTVSAAQQPLRIIVTADLDFSRLAVGQGGGTVTLESGGRASVAGDIAPVGGHGFTGRVGITGSPNRTVRIALPVEIELTSATGGVARVRGIAADVPPVARLGPDGRLEFAFGGRLELRGAASGDYRGRIPVTVSYE